MPFKRRLGYRRRRRGGRRSKRSNGGSRISAGRPRVRSFRTKLGRGKKRFHRNLLKQAASDYFTSKYAYEVSAQTLNRSGISDIAGGFCTYSVIAQNHLPTDYKFFTDETLDGTNTQPRNYANTGGYDYANTTTNVYACCESQVWISNVTSLDTWCCLYQCVPRRTVESSENALYAKHIGISPYDGATGIGPQGFHDVAIEVANGPSTSNSFWSDPAYTPFQNPRFCQFFKISKCYDFKLAPGATKHIRLNSPKYRHWSVGPDKITDLAWKGQPFLLLKFWGSPAVSVGTLASEQKDAAVTNTSNPVSLTGAPAAVGFGHAQMAIVGYRKYCSREIMRTSTRIRAGLGSYDSTIVDMATINKPVFSVQQVETIQL